MSSAVTKSSINSLGSVSVGDALDVGSAVPESPHHDGYEFEESPSNLPPGKIRDVRKFVRNSKGERVFYVSIPPKLAATLGWTVFKEEYLLRNVFLKNCLETRPAGLDGYMFLALPDGECFVSSFKLDEAGFSCYEVPYGCTISNERSPKDWPQKGRRWRKWLRLK
jgi:hypothetical protein